jgi:hypothetical protein
MTMNGDNGNGMSTNDWYYFVAGIVLANGPVSFAAMAKIARRTKGTASGLRVEVAS